MRDGIDYSLVEKRYPLRHFGAMNNKLSILVTGSDGFLGRHLVPYLAERGHRVIAASRSALLFEDPSIISARLPDLSLPFDCLPLL
jgi:hypothetical protein